MKKIDLDNICFKDGDIKKWLTVLLAVLACVLRLSVSYTQYATIYPPLAPIDDDLMFKAAQSIVRGDWLGEYNRLTLSKHAFFALWLAFLHILKIPFLVGNMALWILASAAFTLAAAPGVKKNWGRLLLFLGLVYNPAACRQYATRVYRDAIFPSLCLLFFAGVVGVGLRYRERCTKWLAWGGLYGVSFGCIYLCREDGVWVVPFALCALAAVIGLNIFEKRGDILKKTAAAVLPFALSGLIIGGYCYMNYRYYGRFIVSDFTSREFKSAYGAMTSLKQDNWHPMVAVPEDVREDVYREAPMLAPIKEVLEDRLIKGGYYNETIGDFTSGAFYWAMRVSLNKLGVYDTPQKAEKFYKELTAQIQLAVEKGRLETSDGGTRLRKSLTPPIKPEYVPAVLAETGRGFYTVIKFRQCDPLAEAAVGKPEEIREVEDFIHQKGATVLMANTTTPFLTPNQSRTHKFLRVVNSLYSLFIPILFVIALLWQIKQLVRDITEKRFEGDGMLNLALFGILGMAVLRCAMIAFVEVSCFGIGTYVMYLSTVHPLIIAYGFVGFAKTMEN